MGGQISHPHIRIKLESFEDMVLFMLSRVAPGFPLVTITCVESGCFALSPLSERVFVIIESPLPKSRDCKYYYIDDSGVVSCSSRPVIGRPNLTTVRVKEYSFSL
ncbi:MAG: hypothetical protein ACO2O0_10110 [Desulfurococcales archaeon]|jgi:hypothetical protein|nr:hypothetical protein [Desulfurococcales archaeon]